MEIARYDNSDINSILNHAENLTGKTIGDILSLSPYSNKLKSSDKGSVGKIIEKHWFNIELNNSPEPDFEKVGIELKVIPLVQRKKELAVKERTKVCSIDYKKLILESWNFSHAKTKLNKVLFIYYLYDKVDMKSSRIKKIDLWELSAGNNELIIKSDWQSIQQKVIDGLAHELSEKNTKVLAPSRSGSGGKDKNGKLRDLVSQPNTIYSADALKRAFSLKQSFTNQRFQELSYNIKYESIIESLHIDDFHKFELLILDNINKYTGKSIQEISNKFGLNIGNKSKNQIATIVKKAIGFKSVKSNIKEFEQLGITVKTIKVRKRDNRPIEAVSFPTMKLSELLDEIWKESTFKEYINKILFIPIYHESSSLDKKYLGKAFFWSPSIEEEKTISIEWEKYQAEILNGKCRTIKVKNNSVRGYKEVSSLSKESQTDIIHMRPHGRDANDRDEDTLGNSIVKQCFWLNKNFLQILINQLGK